LLRNRGFSYLCLMNKINRLRSLTCFLLVLFLFTPVVLRSLNKLQNQQEVKKTSYIKQTSGSSKIDNQFLYEEKEKEEKTGHGYFPILPSLFVGFNFDKETLSNNQHYLFVSPFPLGGKVPLFLTQRSILL